MFGFRFGWVVCVKLFVWLELVCFVGYFDLRGEFGIVGFGLFCVSLDWFGLVVCCLYALSICYYDGLFGLCVDCWLLVDVCIRGFVCFSLWVGWGCCCLIVVFVAFWLFVAVVLVCGYILVVLSSGLGGLFGWCLFVLN